MNPVERFLRLSAAAVVTVVCAVTLIVLEVLALPLRQVRIKLGNLTGKIGGPLIVWLIGARPRIFGRERIDGSAPAIYVWNHSSNLDLFMGIWLCPMPGCGVVKRAVTRMPFIGQAYWLSGHLAIDRKTPARARAALNEIARLAARHKLSIWISPEGTQSSDGRLLPFKKGFVHLALATRLPVVPIVFGGAHEVWPARSADIRGGAFEVHVLEAIETTDWDVSTVGEHLDEVRAAMLAVLPESQLPA